MSIATVTFELSDGRTLKCEYGFKYYPATRWEPSEFDAGEATYFIDDEEIAYADLPKGLDAIADKMYEDSQNKRFSYSESEVEREYDFNDLQDDF